MTLPFPAGGDVYLHLGTRGERLRREFLRPGDSTVIWKSAALSQVLGWCWAQAACSSEGRGWGGECREGGGLRFLLTSGIYLLRCSQAKKQRQNRRGKEGDRKDTERQERRETEKLNNEGKGESGTVPTILQNHK